MSSWERYFLHFGFRRKALLRLSFSEILDADISVAETLCQLEEKGEDKYFTRSIKYQSNL